MGLPITLADMGVTVVVPEEILAVAERATEQGESIYNTNLTITVDKVFDAILAADAIGRAYHAHKASA